MTGLTGLTDTEFAWTMAGLAGIALTGVVAYANRRRTAEPDAVERAHAFVLGDPGDDEPDWTADRPALISVRDASLLGWLLRFGGPAEDGAIVGVSSAVPDATIRYVYPDEQVIDVSMSVLVSRDVLPEWSAGPRAWASDADIDGHAYTGPTPPDADRWVVPSSTVLSATPIEEIRENIRQALLAETPERVVTHVEISGPEVWDFLKSEFGMPGKTVAEKINLGDIPVVFDTDLPDHTMRYVYSDETVDQRDISGVVRLWQIRNAAKAALAAEQAALRQAEIAELDRSDTIAEAQQDERLARTAQHPIEHALPTWGPLGGDPNGEVTAPVEHADRRADLTRIAATHEQHLGIEVRHEPGHDDTIPVSPWDAKPAGFGRIVPAQRDGSES